MGSTDSSGSIRGRRPTITDVAAAAGASRSTAARALSGIGYVSPEVRAEVHRAAKQLGYVPDALARSLKRRSSASIGLMVSDFGNYFYAQIASGASRAAKELGYSLLLADTDGSSSDELAAAENFLAQRVAGVIVAPVSAGITSYFVQHGIAAVEVDRTFSAKKIDAVTVSNAEGARQVTEHLIGLGHQRIALIIDETSWTTGQQRQAGYRAALDAAGLPPTDDLVVASGWSADEATRAVTALLGRNHRPTAIFAANNVIAEGAWRAAQALRIRIPDEVSLVAFDDAPWMSLVQPAVTTTAQNPYALGAAAVRQLLERAANPDKPRTEVVLGTELVLRDSTGPAPRGG